MDHRSSRWQLSSHPHRSYYFSIGYCVRSLRSLFQTTFDRCSNKCLCHYLLCCLHGSSHIDGKHDDGPCPPILANGYRMTPNKFFRVFALLAAALTLFGTCFFSPLWPGGGWPFGLAVSFAFASLCLLCIWFSVRGQRQRDRMCLRWGIVSGCAFGFVGMLAGVIGSTFLWPQSNLAPILGFFVTGPYSFAGGVLIGVLVGWFVTHRKTKASESGKGS